QNGDELRRVVVIAVFPVRPVGVVPGLLPVRRLERVRRVDLKRIVEQVSRERGEELAEREEVRREVEPVGVADQLLGGGHKRTVTGRSSRGRASRQSA